MPSSLLTENGFLSGIICKTESGEETIFVRGLFIAIGNAPANRLFKDFGLTSDGYIGTDGEMETAESGIFAAGDIRDKNLRQIVTAASDGATAAVSALKYLKSK